MTTTLLVANRGEIAVRIIRTAKKMGLRTVAVFSDADRGAPHVHLADDAIRLGPAPARESYLVVEGILAAAEETGADLVHPGYGFLSENAAFARQVEAAGMVFVGPTPDQLELFGAKHTAREAARQAGVPMLAGTGLLSDVDVALTEAERIGYPVMLKATAGGGGIGMRACRDAAEVKDAWDSVVRLAAANFDGTGVFLERLVEQARHVEVQVFGDGEGRVLALGDRDCSMQRRNQKVLEEAPAPNLPPHVRAQLAESSVALASSVDYRSAGTVEFVYDADREEVAFLEVNTRLQVEHPVTEAVYGVDLVEWMLRLATGSRDFVVPPQRGNAVEARVYAENPVRDYQPSAGVLTGVRFSGDVRVDSWIEPGTEVGTHYDPLLAKVIAYGDSRAEAWSRLADALTDSRVDGIETNLGLLRAACRERSVLAATHSTGTLADVVDREPRIEVLRPGTMTTVQDWPGRLGLWDVGVPPSGPMDDRSFRIGNGILGNPAGAAGLECTVDGPALRFTDRATVCVTGAPASVTVDGVAVPQWEPVPVPAGGTLDVGAATAGLRTYVLVAGGLDIPKYLGSAATFTLGKFGGHGGRALRTGDVLRPGKDIGPWETPSEVPSFGNHWDIATVEGPHAAPEFFTEDDIDVFYDTDWQVHFNSARTGVRLVGPRPGWARPDGGEAGLHPSNIHDTPYSVGAVDYTGDLPILLGPDGPSLGGFVCPATVVTGERWKLGQLRPGDTVRFVSRSPRDGGVLSRLDATDTRPSVTYRRSGDDNLLVEYGPMQLDLALRMRVHALASALADRGITGLTPGIRSLQVRADPDDVLDLVRSVEADLPATRDLAVPSRTVHLPLSWDDPATREAIARYMAGVRDDAPWCPWNIEFIRRVNGLSSVDDVYRVVFDAEYLVLGLGDVYLGAPVATPLDPRHRLVTTKYNPARTWTAENSVGIGGAYLCIYGMEGPGGYQFVGRTTQVWRSWQDGDPWLLRFFDRIKWYPVSADELLDLRADTAAGRWEPRTEPGEFVLSEHEDFLAANSESIAEFRERQAAAFSAERAAWEAAGEFAPRPEPELSTVDTVTVVAPPGGHVVEAPFMATVWRVDVRPGDRVRAGDGLLALEAMKTETVVSAPADGEVVQVLVTPGDQVGPGTAVVVLR
ncbi:5-oxoprolinase/urea amidolyase family protein [Actinocrispum wychmicini]|uniref:Urea carboxylase n=1 Tax=Actinocrispum wychmicini TaxID=1213861 RepID=A0A4R2J5Y0_9PSEU|nr:5-oxoprolinase/urea amidolyase family protein [Actinocrispum wychmicini]TCO53784.1 urea carboxylase [Actinocrispum wychmicini]